MITEEKEEELNDASDSSDVRESDELSLLCFMQDVNGNILEKCNCDFNSLIVDFEKQWFL